MNFVEIAMSRNVSGVAAGAHDRAELARAEPVILHVAIPRGERRIEDDARTHVLELVGKTAVRKTPRRSDCYN